MRDLATYSPARSDATVTAMKERWMKEGGRSEQTDIDLDGGRAHYRMPMLPTNTELHCEDGHRLRDYPERRASVLQVTKELS